MPEPELTETDTDRLTRLQKQADPTYTFANVSPDDFRWLLQQVTTPIDRDAAFALYTEPRREAEYTTAQLVGLAQANHMWINAFTLIRPTDGMLRDIGAWVVRELQGSPIRDDFIGQTKVAYLRVNAS
jgi:hypothetical protein